MGRPLLVITSNAKILGEISRLQKKKKSITLLYKKKKKLLKGSAQLKVSIPVLFLCVLPSN